MAYFSWPSTRHKNLMKNVLLSFSLLATYSPEFTNPFTIIDHFTVSCLVAWPLNESEAGGELVLIETSLLFSCK